jgi:phage-related protein (TIGR01555 family)
VIVINGQIEINETMRTDGYTNIINKYNTEQDNSTAYRFQREGIIPDVELTSHYECNGLFAKIIDSPSEEAVKHGFELGIKEQKVIEAIENTFDNLNRDEAAATAIKWARLYGGSIIVMLIDDGGELTAPLNVKKIRKADELRVYERSIVNPDYTAMLYGRPQYYQVSSIYGYFVVHESRCLVFKNGTQPEQTANMQYRFWGIPEYLRISRELRECSTSHGHGVKLLERSVQAVYKMEGLSEMLDTEDGEDVVLKRLRVIDRARGILNSIAISSGEDYDFKTITFAGVEKIIETTCNMLSAVTSIPQTVLFGRSPAGMNATGKSDLENYYNLIERIMLRSNLKILTDIIIRAAIVQGEITEKPKYKIGFKPLWSLSETEQSDVEQKKAQTASSKRRLHSFMLKWVHSTRLKYGQDLQMMMLSKLRNCLTVWGKQSYGKTMRNKRKLHQHRRQSRKIFKKTCKTLTNVV